MTQFARVAYSLCEIKGGCQLLAHSEGHRQNSQDSITEY